MTTRTATRWLLPLLTITFLAPAAWAQDIATDEPLPVDPAVVVGTLDNGMRYYIRANGWPENRAELRLVVNAGSILEDDDQRGLAHFVEHMAFNGSRNFPEQEIRDYLERIGMRFGPDLNAYTSFDETVYMLTVPTDSAAVMATAFRILEDWASGLLFDPDAIEQERNVVIEEWRGRRGAQARVLDRQYPVMLHGSRYAERLPIGEVEVLQTFPHDALVRFYRDWYRPDLMAVVAVGDFDPEQIEALVREHLGSIPPPVDGAPERTAYPVPGHAGTLVDITTDPELTTSRVELYHKLPATSVTTAADYRRALLSSLFNRMLNARLVEIAERANPPFLAAQSGYGSLTRGADAYMLAAVVADGGIARGLDALTTEAQRVARHGFTESELARHAADLLRAYERAYAERERTPSASLASEYVAHFLTGEAIPGIEYEYDLVRSLLPSITVEEVNRLAREWIRDDDRVVLVSAPASASDIPDEAEILAILADVADRAITAYEDDVPDVPLLARTPEPSPVVEEVHHEAVGVTEWRLANGVRVLLKPTDFREDEVLLSAYSPGGTSLVELDGLTAARYAADVVLAGGVGEFSRVQLDRLLAGKAAGAAPYISEREEGFSGSASPKDIETMFQLVYLYFTSPRRDEEAYAALVERLHAALANRDATPAAHFSDTLQVTLSQGHPRSRPPGLYLLGEMDLDRSLAFYRDRFQDAGDYTFVLVGALDPAALRPLVETYLGGLPATGREETWRDHGIRPPSGVVEKVVRFGIEPRSQTQIVVAGPFTDRREDAYTLSSLADLLELRLMEVLREDLGGTYTVGTSASVTLRPEPRYAIALAFGASPDRLDELTGVVFEQIRALAQDGPRPDEVDKVREQQRRARETSIRTNIFWVNQLIAYDRDGRPFEDILTYDRLLDGLSVESLRQAARDWLDTGEYIRVSLYPAADP
ncbi:MAG TPA: insulinase family protein [Longimicrobiales bacterium]|nr:insulinase family protein [Longimicrobiales bacterium]